jgi:MATE family multidrug resistance protein
MFINITTRNLCNATNKRNFSLYTSIINVVVSLGIGYILIFGELGFASYGMAGWGIAVSIGNWFSTIFLSCLVLCSTDMQQFHIFKKHCHKGFIYIKQMFEIGWPMAIQMSLELFSMFTITMMIGWLTTIDLQAAQITQQYMLVLIIPIMGFANASGILVGHSFGAKEYTEIKDLAFANLLLAMGFLALALILFLLFHNVFIDPFLNSADSTYQATYKITYIIFILGFAGLIFDSIRNIVTGALRGLLDTQYPMLIALFTIWIIYVPLAYTLGFIFKFGLIGISCSNIIAMIIGAILILNRWQKHTKFLATTAISVS